MRLAGVMVVTVCVVLGAVVFLGVRWSNGSGVPTTPLDPAVLSALESVPSSTFDQVGAGKVDVRPTPLSGAAALTGHGKPRVLYVGAEYCPFCAAERWAVVVALSRFGTFHGLGQTTSSHADSYPDTPTLSFHGSRYRSRYLSFTGYETQSNQVKGTTYSPLDTLSAADQKVFDTYDGKPYLSLHGAIPFLDLGNRYLSQGSSYSPGLLSGMTHLEIAKALADPSSSIAPGVIGTANAISAALCVLTDNQPAQVCSSPGVTAAASTLDHS
jgi:hypothetical protein